MKKAAIIYHYIALYRLPIFHELMKSDIIDFTLISGNTSEINIKKVPDEYAKIPINKGGLNWKFLENIWIKNKQFLWQKGLLKLVLKSDFDIYIFLGSPYHLSTWCAAILARLKGKQVYYWMHGVYKDKPTKIDWVKLNIFYKIANGFFLYGNRSLEILKKHKVKANNKMHVIYNSLDYEKSLSYRNNLDLANIEIYRKKYFDNELLPTIIFIGRLNFVKRIDMLLEAQDMLRKKHNKNIFNLLIIGDGEERKNLEQQTDYLKLSQNVKFLGAIYDEKLNSELLMYSDLCVTPGEVGLTAMHAMSYGTPVISHDNLNLQMPEVEAIIQGKTGDLYEYLNVESLAKSIENWFTKHPKKSKDVIESCFNIIDKYYNPKFQRKVLEEALS